MNAEREAIFDSTFEKLIDDYDLIARTEPGKLEWEAQYVRLLSRWLGVDDTTILRMMFHIGLTMMGEEELRFMRELATTSE